MLFKNTAFVMMKALGKQKNYSPTSSFAWSRPCTQTPRPFWILRHKREKKKRHTVRNDDAEKHLSLLKAAGSDWLAVGPAWGGNVPKVASWGSFFHFPSEEGGLSQATVAWSSRSPMDRSATCDGPQGNITSPYTPINDHTVQHI